MKCVRIKGALLPLGLVVAVAASAQDERHGRNYKPLPPTVHVQVTVVKAFNGKPFANAGVIFHAVREGKNDGNLEVKTDPDGHANIDVIEQGSHVTLQVIASGYATFATEFDADGEEKELMVKLERPRAQVSVYQDNDGKFAQSKPGVQEHRVTKPTAPVVSPTTPLQTTPLANTPTGTPPSTTGSPTTSGKPQ